jgi:hypothetical protein
MRTSAAVLLLAGTGLAAPPAAPDALADPKKAVEIARTRGKLIFLTVIVDHDHENRAVIENVFRDKEFLKVAQEFVILYANPENEHGIVKVKGADGKPDVRCGDCPSIRCEDHIDLAQNYARAFFPDIQAKTPIHFVLDADEKVVATLTNGDFQTGFNHVPAGTVVGELRKLLQKHGRGLTEAEYAKMEANLSDAKSARARQNVTLELEKLLLVVAVGREVVDVKEAKARVREIDGVAAKELALVAPQVEAKDWEAAIAALEKIRATYPGTLTAEQAAKQSKDVLAQDDVKRLLRARDLYQQGMKAKEQGKADLARKRFEACARAGPGTKYAELAAKELAAAPQ